MRDRKKDDVVNFRFLNPPLLRGVIVDSFCFNPNIEIGQHVLEDGVMPQFIKYVKPMELSASGQKPVGPRARVRVYEKHWKRATVHIDMKTANFGRWQWIIKGVQLAAFVRVEPDGFNRRIAKIRVEGIKL